MKRTSKFTIYHGLAASLALHAALSLPYIVYGLASSDDDEPPPLVIELQGAVADSQTEQKVIEQSKGETKLEQAEAAKPVEAPPPSPAPEPPPSDVVEQPAEISAPPPQPPVPPPTPPETPAKSGSAGANDVKGTEVQQKAQTIRTDPQEIDRLREYVKGLTKKVQANLAYPDEGREAGLQGTATVSFAISATGQIRAGTLKIVESSGQPKLDAGALKTIRASAPFDPPPREMTVAIAVAFSRKR
jgi:protein TonB